MDQQVSPVASVTPLNELAWMRFTAWIARLRAWEVPGWVWVILLWFVFAFPAITLRGTHFEEGTVIALARGALEDGHWLAPHRYGMRFVERPVLLSWMIAGVGWLFGGVTVPIARVIHLMFLLAGGLMVYHLVRPLTRIAPAVFGALCWFACSMVGQKFITAEPDVTLSSLLFGAFFIWWRSSAAGRVSLPAWIGVGLLLGAAGLTKGPQPIAYFTLGVGAYLLIRRRWRDVPGFILANVIGGLIVFAWYVAVMEPGDLNGWRTHSRLGEGMSAAQWMRDHLDFIVSIIVEWLPGSLLLPAVFMALARRTDFHDRDLMLAAVLYAMMGSLVLLAWPGGVATRYAMPANLALAVVAGILFDAWWSSHPRLIAASNTVVISIASYLFLLGWIVMPMFPDAFRETKIEAQAVQAVRATVPGVLYVSDRTNYNILAYITGPIRVMPVADIGRLAVPSLAILIPEDLAALTAGSPGLRVVAHAALERKTGSKLFAIYPAGQ